MGQTAISWTATVLPDGTALPGFTFNPWIGCTKVSAGCANCYAETQNKRYGWTAGWGKGAPRRITGDANWKKPLRWNEAAGKDGVRRRVFCASLADVFDAEVNPDWRDQLWELVYRCRNLEWLILTKRPENIIGMTPNAWLYSQPDWVRIGVTAENQENADKRIPQLLNNWGGKNFVSYEPALGPVYFLPFFEESPEDCSEYCPPDACIDWLICGGESGAGCRPMNLEWARDVRDQCKAAGVPYFFKQIGGFPNKRDIPAEWPEDLQVQEFPKD